MGVMENYRKRIVDEILDLKLSSSAEFPLLEQISPETAELYSKNARLERRVYAFPLSSCDKSVTVCACAANRVQKSATSIKEIFLMVNECFERFVNY